MYLYVFVTKDSLETPFPAVTDQQQPQQNQKLLIHADQVHVASMLNVKKETELHLAHVCQDSVETLMLNVNQNVQPIQSVLPTKHVLGKSVWIHVQEFVGPMHLVQYQTIILLAHVIQGILEILLDTAQE